MRFKPHRNEYKILDRLDEIQIQTGDSNLYYHLKSDLLSLSVRGMLKIASVNQLQLIDTEEVRENGTISAIVKISDPRNDRVIAGASQCDATDLNVHRQVARKKAFRNAIRQAMSPSYLLYALRHFMKVAK